MKKNFLGEILGQENREDLEEMEESREEPETLFVTSEVPDEEEEEPYTAPIESKKDEEVFTQKRGKPQVEAPEEPQREKPRATPMVCDSVMYVQARRVAELKFNFYKWVALAVPVNLLLFFAAYFEWPPKGNMWFVWPLGITGVLLIFQYLRAFVLKGRSLHGMVEGTIHEMAMKESRRKSGPDFL
jgi:hypothetical protein